ncbi:30S ribosomal protein S17 [Engelhardtia mirabilis]|uniref:Small ribosomal subunit protein uS17 n=1 Tax=Engelhardtia mirabilis TaxID=2528011 RepID=A0A518BPC8_9BACT|nr:30S ribosomal protein S17 [Planctomycetes bacterium Pla133]QDV03157.1 30S ribosomal protein S17 [Planctomycetes bacterium Pla86]
MSDTQTQTRNRRRLLQGVVTSDKMDKSITVLVERRFAHPKYGKFVRSHKKYHAHDELNEAHVGDTVEVAATRPLSKTKRWRLVRILESPALRTDPTAAETGAESMTSEVEGGDA